MPGNANSGRYPKLLSAEKSRIIVLSARGMSDRDLAREVGRSLGTVQLVIREGGGVAAKINWDPSPARLSAGERRRSGRVSMRESFAAIARRLGRATSTVSREVNANGGRAGYAGWRAHRRAPSSPGAPRSRSWRRVRGCGPGRNVARGRVVVTDADLGAVASRVPGRSDDVGVARDDLPVAVRAGPRRAAQGARRVPADRAGDPPATVTPRDRGRSRTWS